MPSAKRHSPCRRDYRFHGVRLRVEAEREELPARLDALIGPFALPCPPAPQPFEPADATTRVDVLVNFRVVETLAPTLPPPPSAAQDWSGRDIVGEPLLARFEADGRRCYLSPGAGRLDMEPTGLRGTLHYLARREETVCNACLVPLLGDLLSATGRLLIHAAAVAPAEGLDGSALLLGECGRGKTTAALALALHGGGRWRLACDDACALGEGPGGLEILPLPREVKLAVDATALLGAAIEPATLQAATGPRNGEYRLPLQALGAPPPHSVLHPTTLVFLDPPPTGIPTGAPIRASLSRLRPLAAEEALEGLLRLNLRCPAPAARSTAAAGFALLARLAGSCTALALAAGSDMAALAATLDEALSRR